MFHINNYLSLLPISDELSLLLYEIPNLLNVLWLNIPYACHGKHLPDLPRVYYLKSEKPLPGQLPQSQWVPIVTANMSMHCC